MHFFGFCFERRSSTQYEGDLVTLCGISCNVCRYYVVTFVTTKIIKNKILIIHQNKCWPQKQPNMGEML